MDNERFYHQEPLLFLATYAVFFANMSMHLYVHALSEIKLGQREHLHYKIYKYPDYYREKLYYYVTWL